MKGHKWFTKNIRAEYSYFCNYNYFYWHFHLHYIKLVDFQQVIFRYIMCQKTCDCQIYAKGVPALLYWIHHIILPFISYDPTPNNYWCGGHQTCEHLVGYFYWGSLQENNYYILLCFDVLSLQRMMDMACSIWASQHPSDYFHLPLATKYFVFFPSVQCRSVVYLPSSNIHPHTPHAATS